MLGRENGKERMAEMLKEWLGNKNRDLREREGDVGSWAGMERKMISAGVLDCLDYTVRKRLHIVAVLHPYLDISCIYLLTDSSSPDLSVISSSTYSSW